VPTPSRKQIIEEDDCYKALERTIRFFTHEDKEHFWLFCECLPGRQVEARIVGNCNEIELRIQIEAPPDIVIQNSGLMASAVHLGPTDEFIHIIPSSKISTKVPPTVFTWPSMELPLWVTWKYVKLIKEEQEEAVHLNAPDTKKYVDLLTALK